MPTLMKKEEESRTININAVTPYSLTWLAPVGLKQVSDPCEDAVSV